MEKAFALIIGILGLGLGGMILGGRGKKLLSKLLKQSTDISNGEKTIIDAESKVASAEKYPEPPEVKDMTPDEIKKYWKDKLQ